MTRRTARRRYSWFAVLIALLSVLGLAACSSVAGTSPPAPSSASLSTSPGASPSGPTEPAGSSTAPSTGQSTGPADPAATVLELHYLRSTIAGRQSEHTATVRGDGRVTVTDELDGTEQSFVLTTSELGRLQQLLPVLGAAPEPTSVVSDVGRIDARFELGGREVTVTVDDWSMAGGTSRLPADEREVADAMIELRDLLIREPNGAGTTGATTAPAPTS